MPAVAIGVSLLGGVALATAVIRADADVPLFDTDLHPAQTVEVENALTLWGEPFRANAQGTQVLIAAPRRRDVLLRLTLAGLPRRYIPTSSDVLEDPANALTPQSIIDDRRRSGYEGDLVAGLRRIAGVADATVVLPPSANDPLENSGQSAAPTAAVQLVMQPGAQLSADAVAGIRRFVASAYPGLAPDRVTVVDGSGAVQGATPPPDGSLSKERRVQNAVQSALDAVLGQGSAVVRVSIRTVGTESQSQSTRTIPHGALSADVAHERGTDSGKSFDKERTMRRYAYDTLSERRVTLADAQAKLSVAVFLNANRVDPATGNAIASLVRASAGADLHAGDDVVVEAVPFARISPPAPNAIAQTSEPRALAPAIVACAIALFSFASLPLVANNRAARPAAPDVEIERADAIDPRAAAAFDALEGESPQAAAYVIASLEPDVRSGVLGLCADRRRAAIESFLACH